MLETTCRADLHPFGRASLPSLFPSPSLCSLRSCSPYLETQPPTHFITRCSQRGRTRHPQACPPTTYLALGPPVPRGGQEVPSHSTCCQPPLALLLQNGLARHNGARGFCARGCGDPAPLGWEDAWAAKLLAWLPARPSATEEQGSGFVSEKGGRNKPQNDLMPTQTPLSQSCAHTQLHAATVAEGGLHLHSSRSSAPAAQQLQPEA